MKDINKPCLILDLDETIIYSVSREEKKNLSKEEKEKLNSMKTHTMDKGYYTVIERPGLQEFLDFAFKNFNVAVWTAASKDYALFIIDEIILNKDKIRELDWILFSYHCDVSKKEKGSIKDLRLVWDTYKMDGYNKDNTIIMDDHPDVYGAQKKNCIFMYPFQLDNDNSAGDKFLLKLIPHLEKTIKSIKSGAKINTNKINEQM
jgi:TFIIF-interacting CTD phosphatase-like protein